jgi:8-oxo-dGTP pyrophosphatase MutT (NUDIX family)
MERMSALDAGFYFLEHDNVPMHVGSVAVFEGPLPAYGDVVRLLVSKLPQVPRYRQVVRTVPLHLARPAWVDDGHFEVLYHVRHTAVPAPGGAEQLRNLAGRVFAQRLDMAKPLWEMWLNDRGELLLHRRSANKRAYPLHWSGAAAGHVASGETYGQAAVRETKEEIGVEPRLDFLGKFFSEEDREMVGVFLGHYDGPLKLEPREVDSIEYFSPDRLQRELPNMRVTSFVARSLPLVIPKLSTYSGNR